MNLLKIPATMSKYQGMSHRSMRMQFDSQENLSDKQIASISQLHEKFIWLCCFHEESKENEMLESIKDLPQLVKEDHEKSPSKRLYDVLFIYWKQKGEQGDFQTFYRKYMNNVIDNIKDKLV